MQESQLDFLQDDFMEHLPGPSMTGKEEFLYHKQIALVEAMHGSVADWRPPELPDLSQFKEVVVDLETTGLRWWDGDRMIGAGIWTPDGQKRYLPIRHKVGPNIPEEQFFRWVKHELRDKRIVNIRTKFDLHMFRADGVDLEQQGCTFGDVAHYAALLDDHRRLFNQADLAAAYLGDLGGKVTSANGYELDPTKFAEYPAGLVAFRAEGDVETVSMLQQIMWPQLTAQNLHRVREIEDQIIPVVVEMEHNGAPINREKLDRWVVEAQTAYEEAMWDVRRMTGCDLTSPTKRDEVQRIFHKLNLPLPMAVSEKGANRGDLVFSLADDLLEKIPHPAIQRLRCAIAIASLLSKFLLKYQRSVLRDGILRYELHQLPYQDDAGGGGGAVSGRFASAAPSRDEGANIQQVFGVKTQLGEKDKTTGEYTGFTRHWPVKYLFEPDRSTHKNAVWLKADASQFQFRIFAHYGDDPKIIEAYRRDNDWRAIEERAREKQARGEQLTDDDKLTDFHVVVQRMVSTIKELGRTHTKNVNFAQVFGAGPRKMASQLGVPDDQIPPENEPLESGGPLFLEVLQISSAYHKMFPGVKPLLGLTSHLAMPGHRTGKRKCGRQCRELYRHGLIHRGHVRTFLGRRARFNEGDRFYSALNRIIQGTEGDVNKRVLIAVHAVRHELGLTPRFTVHDELDADLHDPGNLPKVKEVLNTQYYDFKVPILWEAGIGPTWGEA